MVTQTLNFILLDTHNNAIIYNIIAFFSLNDQITKCWTTLMRILPTPVHTPVQWIFPGDKYYKIACELYIHENNCYL